MECCVHRVPMRHPGDASAIIRLIDEGTLAAEAITAIFGKTEGNGCVNDFTRWLCAVRPVRNAGAAAGHPLPTRCHCALRWSASRAARKGWVVAAFSRVRRHRRRRTTGQPQGARHRDRFDRSAASGGHRSHATSESHRDGGSRGDEPRRHRRPGRCPLGADQMPPSDQGARRRGPIAWRANRDSRHLRFDGIVARRRSASAPRWRWARLILPRWTMASSAATWICGPRGPAP